MVFDIQTFISEPRAGVLPRVRIGMGSGGDPSIVMLSPRTKI